MSAATATLAPRTRTHRSYGLPASYAPSAAAARRSSPSLPARYAVPGSVLPNRTTYLRRRVGAAVFVATLVLSVGSVAQRGLADRGGDPASATAVGRTTYVVQPGDTLWAIAERLYPGHDVAEVVDVLVSMNGGASIQAGQTLDLP
ncbi:MAG: LysM peptidoglycan-binding domain-containing protein [Acidimicrobiales bacterium]